MTSIEKHLDDYLVLLRNKIRQRGFTQLEVQETLGWGRSYISQLLSKQKSLRLEQVLSILGVIGVDSREFFAELIAGPRRSPVIRRPPPAPSGSTPEKELEDLSSLLQGLVKLLVAKKVITAAELSTTIQVAEAETRLPN